MGINKIGVIGCGLMGRGIAEISARAGYDVVISEISQELLNKGMQAIDASISRAVAAGKVTEDDKKTWLGRMKGTVSVSDFKDCDIVIEAAIEKLVS